MMRQALIYGLTGQLVEMYPPEEIVVAEGAPTAAATFKVWRGDQSNDDTPIQTGSATLDSVATTVSVASGVSQTDRRKISLTALTGIDPRRAYCVANASEQRQVVTPFEVAAAHVTVENDLAFDYPITTSTFKGLRQTFVIDAAFIALITNINTGERLAVPYRVQWTYATPASITRHLWTYFDVVRQAGQHSVTSKALEALFPDSILMEWRAQRGSNFERQLQAAWKQVVFDLTVCGIDVNTIRDGHVLDHLVELAFLWVVARAGLSPHGRVTETYVAQCREDYKQACAEAFKAPDKPVVPIDTGTTGEVSGAVKARPFFTR